MPVSFPFDFLNPDYGAVFKHRIEMMQHLRDPYALAALKVYYKENPAQFINDWGCTFDPRNADIGLPTTIPFILFDMQEDWIEWVVKKWHNRRPGISEKSRDIGMSWLSVALACTLCLFNEGIVIGFGSRKEEYVDKIGAPKSLFWKARMFMRYIPAEFLGGFNLKRDAPHMRILFPGTRSAITGESGDGIGRGDRTTIYFVDESAHIERPELVDAALSNTTNCRQDISSAKGMANSFAQRRHSGKIDVFTFHWRNDPRKAPGYKAYELVEGSGIFVDWYSKMENDLDPVTLAQEVDINYSASVEGIVIPAEWIKAAIDAEEKLGIEATGAIMAAVDVADEGKDLNALAIRKGFSLKEIRSWSGRNSDTLYTTEKAFEMVDEFEAVELQYDSDGLGAFMRGDSRMINERRKGNGERQIAVLPFRGSGEVVSPERETIKGRKNKDYFQNRKAQAWWMLRLKFQNTFRAIKGEPHDKENLISISSKMKEFQKLIMELSQPTYKINTNGKILIDKAPDGTRSPNLADSVMMVYAPKRSAGLFSPMH